MKVLLANSWWHPRGGDATYTLSLADALGRAGHEVIPFAMRHADNRPSPWERWFAPMLPERKSSATRAVFNDQAARAMSRLLEHARPDVVHLQHVHRHLTPSVIAAAQAHHVPVLWTLHDFELVCPSGHLFARGAPCEACRGHRYLQAIRKRCKKNDLARSAFVAAEKTAHRAWGLWGRVDRFLCPSRFLADKVVSFGLPADRTHHLPPFVDAGVEPVEQARDGVVFAGRFAVEKGIRPLLDIAERCRGHRFTFIGAGTLDDEVRRRAARASNIRVMPWLTPDALRSELEAHAIAVVPSLWFENQPYAVFEAQAAGCAVVASAHGGMLEQVRDGEDGLLLPPGDIDAWVSGLRGLLDDRPRCRALGARGRQRVERDWTEAAHISALEGHYEAVR